LKTESQYKWKYEGNKVQFLLISELLDELTQSIWAIDNSKVEYARETITEVIDKFLRIGISVSDCLKINQNFRYVRFGAVALNEQPCD
jgi:hypothetical protein